MSTSVQLPPDYVWEEDNGEQILSLNGYPLVRVAPVGSAWRVETLLEVPDITPQQVAVRRAEYGRGWANRWVLQRQRLIAPACGRPELAPPVVHGPPRRIFAWQMPSWARAS
jgi:hypothetical protein